LPPLITPRNPRGCFPHQQEDGIDQEEGQHDRYGMSRDLTLFFSFEPYVLIDQSFTLLKNRKPEIKKKVGTVTFAKTEAIDCS